MGRGAGHTLLGKVQKIAWKVAPPGALGAWEPQVKTATVAAGDSSWLGAVRGGESLELVWHLEGEERMVSSALG